MATLVTYRLDSQAVAVILRLLPNRNCHRRGGTTAREVMCWDKWAEAGRYLLDKLTDLKKRQPEQLARDLSYGLMQGWFQRLESKNLPAPQFDRRQRNYWGSFEDRLDQVFVRVVLSAQHAAERHGQSLHDRRVAGTKTQSEPEEEAADKGDELDDSGNIHRTLTTPSDTIGLQMIDNGAQHLLAQVTTEVEKHIVAQYASSYQSIAHHLILRDTQCTGAEDLYP